MHNTMALCTYHFIETMHGGPRTTYSALFELNEMLVIATTKQKFEQNIHCYLGLLLSDKADNYLNELIQHNGNSVSLWSFLSSRNEQFLYTI